MKVVLVLLGVVAIAHCIPRDVYRREAEVDVVVQKILAALTPDKVEEKPEVPVTTEKPENKTEKAEVKSKREDKVAQITDSKTSDPEGIAIATSSQTISKDPKDEAIEKSKRAQYKRATVQSTSAEGASAIATGDLTNEGKVAGSLLQSTKATGGKIAFASSKMTTTSGSDKKPADVPASGKPSEPLPAPAKPLEPLPAPAKPSEPLPAPAPEVPVTTTLAPALPEASLPAPQNSTVGEHPSESAPPSQSISPAGLVQESVDPKTGEKVTQVIKKP